MSELYASAAPYRYRISNEIKVPKYRSTVAARTVSNAFNCNRIIFFLIAQLQLEVTLEMTVAEQIYIICPCSTFYVENCFRNAN